MYSWLNGSNATAQTTQAVTSPITGISTNSGTIDLPHMLLANDNGIFYAPEFLLEEQALGQEIMACTKAVKVDKTQGSEYGIFNQISRYSAEVFIIAWYIPITTNHEDGDENQMTLCVELKFLKDDAAVSQDLNSLKFDNIFKRAYDKRIYIKTRK